MCERCCSYSYILRTPKTFYVDTTNSQYYVHYVLNLLVEKYIVPYFGDNVKKVIVDHDEATSHIANYTANYIQNISKKYGISFQDSRYTCERCRYKFYGLFRIRLCIYIKQEMEKPRAKTELGVWKNVRKSGIMYPPKHMIMYSNRGKRDVGQLLRRVVDMLSKWKIFINMLLTNHELIKLFSKFRWTPGIYKCPISFAIGSITRTLRGEWKVPCQVPLKTSDSSLIVWWVSSFHQLLKSWDFRTNPLDFFLFSTIR